MSSVIEFPPDRLLDAARAGHRDALGRLLEVCGSYLKVLATSQLDPKLGARVSPSDVVQDTLLEAHRDFPRFSGGSHGEFLAWLRRILANNLARQIEVHILAGKRDVRREVSLHAVQAAVDRSNDRLIAGIADSGTSPGSRVAKNEQTCRLADLIAGLPPDYRRVIVLRNLEARPFAEIAQSMQRSEGAVRMLWLRALEQLRVSMDQEEIHD